MGFFGTNAGIAADVTLLLQIIVIFILLLGYKFRLDKKLRRHGLTMSFGLILHIISILTYMIPSLINFSDILISQISSIPAIVTWIHAIVGLISVIVGLYIVVEWRFRPPPNMTCAKRKPLMKPLIIIWILALILGIVVYLYAYL